MYTRMVYYLLNKNMKHKTFVIGDIHGAYKALKQVLEYSKFDYEKDTLISLGDVADGWGQVPQCFEELMRIKNLIYIRGNHDQWLLDWLQNGDEKYIWVSQGGKKTLEAYTMFPEFKEKHKKFLEESKFYHVDKKNRLFVHGGINPYTEEDIKDISSEDLMWNRDLYNDMGIYKEIKKFKEIFVGHTSVYNFNKKIAKYENVYFLDTGAGWEGILSIMDIDTKQAWKSDIVSELYKEEKGR